MRIDSARSVEKLPNAEAVSNEENYDLDIEISAQQVESNPKQNPPPTQTKVGCNTPTCPSRRCVATWVCK